MKDKHTTRMYNFYIQNAELIGYLYCAIPSIIWFIALLVTSPFREVYILRLFICLAIGAPISSYINRFGLSLWMAKNLSPKKAGILDGILIGSSLGIGMSILPSLTSFIYSNHIEQAKSFMIYSIIIAGVLGALIGSFLASVGRDYANSKGYFKKY
jgi:hypothetical protein